MIFESKVFVAFDQSGVAGAVVSRGPRGARLLARAEAPLADGALLARAAEDNLARPEEVRAALARVYKELGGNGRRAALVLPEGIARLALLEVPPKLAPAEFARFRLAPALPFAAAEALVDGVAAPPSSFLAAALRRSVVRSYEAVAAAAGFTQDRVDLLSLLALAPLLQRPDPARTILAVVLGDAAFTLAFVDSGRLALVRTRRRDRDGGEYVRLRDELTRTAALAGAASAPRVVAFGADAADLAAALRAEGWSAEAGLGGGEPVRGAAGWLATVLR